MKKQALNQTPVFSPGILLCAKAQARKAQNRPPQPRSTRKARRAAKMIRNIATENGGWLIPDYWHPDEHTTPHLSLNHQLAECLALYHAADLLNRKDLRALADRMLLAIVDTGSGWVMPNHNLYYSIKPDGTYVEGDYPYLTYNDLYDLRKYLSSSERPELETLTYLMGEKLQWMQNNGVTGYEKG